MKGKERRFLLCSQVEQSIKSGAWCVFIIYLSFFAVFASVAYCVRAYVTVALPSQRAAGRIKHTHLADVLGTLPPISLAFPLSWRSLGGALCRFLQGDVARHADQETSDIASPFANVRAIAEHHAERMPHLWK